MKAFWRILSIIFGIGAISAMIKGNFLLVGFVLATYAQTLGATPDNHYDN
jgi:hypothetical protein